jgi:hypothetical protein
MAKGFDAAKFKREVRAAERKAAAEWKRGVRAAERKAETEWKREVARVNRRIDAYNRKAERHNRAVIADLNRQLRAGSSGPRYTVEEEALADRIQHAVAERDDRECDTFLSYARIDGAQIADTLSQHLDDLGVSVWFDRDAIIAGKSQSLQMDKGLQKARAGIVVLTRAYLEGRFWTERELGALLHKEMLIPVLHGVAFKDVAEYSGILPDLAGFETSRDSVDVIAQKIAAAVVG